ncbi:MAG: cation transporter, partial [Pseudomonadota bacterium]
MHAQELLDHTSPARYQASLRVTLVNIATNLFLTIAQVVIGLFGHSQALVADGMHTLSDTLADLLVLFALKHGQRGA